MNQPPLPASLTLPVRIGTRASALALAQANEVKARLHAAWPALRDADIAIVSMTTTGDQVQDRKLNAIGGKGLFTKEIEEALLAGKVALAVHSVKDMPAILPPTLIIPCMLEREDVRDALISRHGALNALPQGAMLGTSSLRREAQLRHHRPDLKIVPFRGNVQTRLRKLEAGEADATLLAVAGLKRLGMAEAVAEALPIEICLPAVAQGAIGIECREDDTAIQALLAPLNHAATFTCVTAERAFMRRLEGSCRTPIAAYAQLSADRKIIAIDGLVAAPDGSQVVKKHHAGDASNPEAIGHVLAEAIIADIGEATLRAWRCDTE